MSEKAFSYYRVSSKEQQESGASLEAQQIANRNYAQQHGLEIIKEFEEVQSASKAGRKNFEIMVKEIRRNKSIKHLIFHDVDRCARRMKEWAIIHDIKESGVSIHFSRENMDMEGRSSTLMANLKAVIAVDQIENLRNEVKKGQAQKLGQGFDVVGSSRLGYIPIGKGVREVNWPVAHLIRQCFEFYATGKHTYVTLAAEMNKKGLRSNKGNIIDKNKISRILCDKYYIGLMKVNDIIYQGRHEPIVPLRLFNKVQKILADRYHPKKIFTKYLFPRLFKCGYCGKYLKPMTGKKIYRYYYCRYCKKVSIREEKVEQMIFDNLEQLKFDDKWVDLLIDVAKRLRRSSELELVNREKSLTLTLRKYEGLKSVLLDKYLQGQIVEADYVKKNNEYIMLINQTQTEINEYKENNVNKFVQLERLAKLIRDPTQAYKVANQENCCQLIESLTEELTLTNNSLKFHWQTPFQLLVDIKKDPQNEDLFSCDPFGFIIKHHLSN
jgi:DNA invertase Pin-like site-specific DNA recombinase